MRFADRLRELKIYNTHGILSQFAEPRKDIAVSFSGAERMRAAKTSVWSVSHKTDPKAHWQDYGKKTFVGSRSETLEIAKSWASDRYRIKEWKPCPFGSGTYIPAETLKKLKEFEASQNRNDSTK